MVRLRPHLIAVSIVIMAILTADAARTCPFELPITTATVKGRELTVEIAATPQSRSCGLSRRSRLPENRAMLFVYPKPQKLSFWMKETFVPLSIAFIDDAGRITAILKMDLMPATRLYSSPGKARYALEVNQGWFEENGVGVGDVVEFNLPVMLNIQ